jgi:hypothetical protein
MIICFASLGALDMPCSRGHVQIAAIERPCR